MTEQLDPKLVQRIQKLHSMAESARDVGSLEEAQSFMDAVTKTLNKYNLDMSVLSIDLRDAADPMGVSAEWGSVKTHQNRPVRWAQDLASHVAMAHNCATLVAVKNSAVFFYGRASNRGVAVRMFKYLRDMAERMNWAEYEMEVRWRRKQYGSEKGGRQWRLNWLEAFVDEVGRRYYAMRQRVEADKGMAMVLVSVRQEAEAAAAAGITVKVVDTDNVVTANQWSAEARERGKVAAQSVNLRPDALDEPDVARKQLSGGR